MREKFLHRYTIGLQKDSTLSISVLPKPCLRRYLAADQRPPN